MHMTFQQGNDEISKLCEYFALNRDSFRSPAIKEAHVRQSLIDPLFEALGWDMANKGLAAPQYREVITEDSLEIEGHQKSPDYSFRIGPQSKFFVEAKKCRSDLFLDQAPAYQLRRYGWSAKVSLSILTDFEELGVYDCSIRPRPSDKASFARVKYVRFEEYPARWREIWDLFSREAVWSGAYDNYAGSKRKRGTSEVDSEFLKEIESWRELLAKNIALRNANLPLEDLNASVQLIIDRIVFLRIAEDRGIEPYEQLLKLCERSGIYGRFIKDLCLRADQKYNSGLFHFHNEKGVFDAPDITTPKLRIDDKTIQTIIQSLYFIHGSPYHFGVMPVEILGTVYERFLGKVIRLTSSHQAKIDEKPEVRKAGGVYYTPEYVVDFIVKETIGKDLSEKTIGSVRGNTRKAPLRILDMACGSGSFLINAYQTLLDFYFDVYSRDSIRPNKAFYKDSKTGQMRLSIEEKKRILIDHIYGVDIDPQAVEVSKLSLLLKVLEGETTQTFDQQMRLFQERALPNLSKNIKCGNSIIGTDFSLSLEDLGQIHAFDWRTGFPEVFREKHDGFDVIVGNPPWGAILSEPELAYLREKHHKIVIRMIDSFMYFADKAISLIRPSGRFGMILPDVLLYQTDNERLRRKLVDETCLHRICNMGNVFDQVVRPACVVVLSKNLAKNNDVFVADFTGCDNISRKHRLSDASQYSNVKQSDIGKLPGTVFATANLNQYLIWDLIRKVPNSLLAEVVDGDGIQRGVSPDLKESFIVDSQTATKCHLEKDKLRPVLTGGKHVKEFCIEYPDLLLIYTSRQDDFSKLPNIRAFIDQHREQITCKEVLQKKHSIYSLHRAREEKIFTKPSKLLGVITEDEIVLALDTKQTFATDGLYLFSVRPEWDAKYVMGILNSKLFKLIYRLLSLEKGRALAQVKPTVLENLPIRTIDSSDQIEIKTQSMLIGIVDKLMDAGRLMHNASSEQEKQKLADTILAAKDQLDRYVYELYGISEKHIRIIKDAVG
jgi:type I restriction-modification system DNA methylase subunit